MIDASDSSRTMRGFHEKSVIARRIIHVIGLFDEVVWIPVAGTEFVETGGDIGSGGFCHFHQGRFFSSGPAWVIFGKQEGLQ